MTQPRTHLLTAPADVGMCAFGQVIHSNDLIRKLKRINPRVYHWQASANLKASWDGESKGSTCLWISRGGGKADKITAFGVGPIPEFSQIGPEGLVIVKGWKAIFERCISCRVTTRNRIEQVFGVSLDYHEKTDATCISCLKERGSIVKTSAPGALCFNHQGVRDAVDTVQDRQGETSYQRKVAGVAPGQALPRKAQKEKVTICLARS